MTYSPNPFVTYRVNVADPEMVDVTAAIDADVRFDYPGGSLRDLSHSGRVQGRQRYGLGVETVSLSLSFSGFTPPGSVLNLEVMGDHEGDLAGQLVSGDARLARVTGRFFDALADGSSIMSWEGACASGRP